MVRINPGDHVGDDGGEAERLAAVIATRGETPVLVAIDGRFSGAFGLADVHRTPVHLPGLGMEVLQVHRRRR